MSLGSFKIQEVFLPTCNIKKAQLCIIYIQRQLHASYTNLCLVLTLDSCNVNYVLT